MIRVAIISPHLDDAVLSCWHKIDQPNTETITVFAGVPQDSRPSLWDRLNGQYNSREAMIVRREENAHAVADTPTVVTNLDLLDRPYTKEQRNLEAIADMIDARAPDPETTLVVAAGVGTHMRHHPDHVAVRQAGLILRRRGRNVSFYVDIPYSLPVFNLENWPDRLQIKKLIASSTQI